jgi:phage tail-like protein
MADTPRPPSLASAFSFQIGLNLSAGNAADPKGSKPAIGNGGFQECSGLEIEMDIQELVEGGRNDGTVRLVGRGKFSPIVLKRGMFVPDGGKVGSELWLWMQNILTGNRPVARYDGQIDLISPDRTQILATWLFFRGLPSKISGPQFNAKTGEIAIEEITIQHEGLQLKI